MVQPIIKIISEKKLIGKHLTMSLSNNKTVELWKSFMPFRNEIINKVSTDLFSMQVYDESFNFKDFNPDASFEKWAAIEVTNFDNVPQGMESIMLPTGLYAVFHHKGDTHTGAQIFGYIYNKWLPNSAYILDNRPHFELLGNKYKNGAPDSEEDIWIPIKPKK